MLIHNKDVNKERDEQKIKNPNLYALGSLYFLRTQKHIVQSNLVGRN